MMRVVKADYPHTRKTDVVDELHSVTVPDPYRWLEDVDSDETGSWVAAQQALTESVLETIDARGTIRRRLDALSDHEIFGTPKEAGGRLFFTWQSAVARQPSLCWCEMGSDAVNVLVDPQALADDATIAIEGFEPSPSGRYVAYGLAEAGSDWQTLRVLDVESGEHLSDELSWVKFPLPSWRPDESGFFYGALEPPPPGKTFKAPITKRSLRSHRLGEQQDEDAILYERPDEPIWLFSGRMTGDGRYLVITIRRGTFDENRVSIIDFESPKAEIIDLLPEFDGAYQLLGSDDRTFFFLTTRDAPHGRIVAIDLDRPKPSSWTVLVPESDDVLQTARYIGGRFVVSALRDAVAQISVYDQDGSHLHDVDLPGDGTVGLLEGCENRSIVRFSYTDFLDPGVVLAHDVNTGRTETFRRISLPFDRMAFVVERSEIRSTDGTMVPIFLAHHRDIEIGPETPTCLFGYGGFNIPMSPQYRPDFISWMDLGGQLAVACIRGGGEFGTTWHQAGARENRANVFADFIAAAEWLVATRRTSVERLAIYGRSNGGLLVGACMTKRPDLFGVCLPAVGVLDMLRFHRFTVGSYWVSDYGSPDDPGMLPILLGYSPLHNVTDGTAYPPTMITTADHDDRVFPAHSFKFAAALQAAQAGDAPILLRIDHRAGHGLGKPKTKLLDEIADRWAFALDALGAKLSMADVES